MYDQLIDSIISARKIKCGDHTVYHLFNCFTEQELKTFEEPYTHAGTPVPMQEHKPRLQFPDGPFVHGFNQSKLLETFNAEFNKSCKEVMPIFWEDREGYKIDRHIDNDAVPSAIQIYLPSNASSTSGTRFLDESTNTEVVIPFKPNTGYICPESTKILHESGDPVGKGLTRRSLYIIIV